MRDQSVEKAIIHLFRIRAADPDPNLSDPCVLGLLDADPDPLVRGMDPDPNPDPSITKQK
jgi:hypothetical protein